MGFMSAVTFVLFIYKLSGYLDCSWFDIFLPMIVTIGLKVFLAILRKLLGLPVEKGE